MQRGRGWGAVMAIKKVPSDASIRIGSMWFPVRNLPAALARHTKLVFCLTGSDDHPYSLRGSATGLKFQDRHLLFCCGLQIVNIEPRNVVISLDKEGRTLISGEQMVSLDHVQELLGEEILDLTAMRFDPAKYGPSPIDLGFFDIRGSDVWNGDPQTTFLVFGYPTSLRSVEIDDVSGRLNTASNPSSTSWRLVRSIVAMLMSSAAAIRLSLQPSPASDTSAFKRMRAFVSSCAERLPLLINSSSWARSSALNRTTYFLTAISFPTTNHLHRWRRQRFRNCRHFQ